MINNIHDLKAEKKRLQKKQAALEEKLCNDWSSLKETVNPGFSRKLMKSTAKRIAAPSNVRELVRTSMRYGISLLASKITDKATGKLDKFF